MLKTIFVMCNCARLLLLLVLAGLFGTGWVPCVLAEEEIPLQAVPMTAPLVTTSFIPLLPFGNETDVKPQFMPVASNAPMEDAHPDITRVIIAIHDQSRDASRLLLMLQTLAGAENDHTLILAPQFLLEADIIRFENRLPDKGKMFARWSLNGLASPWESGGDSVALPPQKGISAFSAIDILLMYLADRTNFPALEQVVMVGHGKGGDFVQHYAAAGQAPEILAQKKLPLRYVVANPESYLYLTAQRPRNGKQGFAVPAADSPTPCPDYDAYPYGLNQVNVYVRRVGSNAIKLRYAARNVIYLIGENVALQDAIPDSSCAAQLQGLNRMMRAQNYGQYLDMLFGEAIQKQQSFVRVPKVGLDAGSLLGSRCGMIALFDNGMCR